jgi:hypothetical protein
MNVKAVSMKKSTLVLLTGLLLMLFLACKKDKNNPDPPVDTPPVKYTTTDIQVVFPTGSTASFSGLKVFTLTGSSEVNGEGKATIPFITGGAQLAFLFDASNNLILTSYITSSNKQISIKSTSQALLLQGLQLVFLPDTVKIPFLEKSASASRLAGYYARMEETFKSDQLMLGKGTYKTILADAVTSTKDKPISTYGKQIYVVDADVKSKLQIEGVDVENVNILNAAYRRTHAFIYKTAFKNASNLETVLITTIDYDDAADKNMLLEKVKYIDNIYDQLGVAQGYKKAATGPILLPVGANEKEATYKIRVLGPGKPVSAPLTDAEKQKLDELYYEYLGYDIIAPLTLEALGYRSLIVKMNDDALKIFYEKVKLIAMTDSKVIEKLRSGDAYGAIQAFYNAAAAANVNTVALASSLIECMRQADPGAKIPFPSADTLSLHEQQLQKGLDLIRDATGVVIGPFILAPHEYYNEMESFEVKSRDNNVKLTPDNSAISNFTNLSLTANPNVELSSGQTLLFKWTTTSAYGVLKGGSQQGPSLQTTTPTITYYANAQASTLGEDNYDRIVVTVYIKEGGSETLVGSDTSTVNVKKNKLVMNPTNAEIDMAHGGSRCVKLYLLKTDGTNDIFPNSVIDYKVVWTTGGSYGQFQNQSPSYTAKDNNTAVYCAFDNENLPDSVVENITAKVYFKTKGQGDDKWMLREEVKGKVTLINNDKKIVYYIGLQAVHTHPPSGTGNRCATGAIAVVKKHPKGIAYKIEASGLANKNYPTDSDSWTVTGTEKHIRGYAGYAFSEGESGDDYWFGIYGTFTWSGGPVTDHFPGANPAGTAKVTVWLKD